MQSWEWKNFWLLLHLSVRGKCQREKFSNNTVRRLWIEFDSSRVVNLIISPRDLISPFHDDKTQSEMALHRILVKNVFKTQQNDSFPSDESSGYVLMALRLCVPFKKIPTQGRAENGGISRRSALLAVRLYAGEF